MLSILQFARPLLGKRSIRSMAGGISTASGGYLCYRMQRYFVDSNIDYTLKNGTNPRQLPHRKEATISRPDVVVPIKSALQGSANAFTVVTGPSGTGKTFATIEACRSDPSYILYLEVNNPGNLANEMAEVAGISRSASFWDFISRHVFPNVVAKHRMPDDDVEDMNFVLDNAARRAEHLKKNGTFNFSKRYREMPHKMPSFVIDGVDLLAKTNPRVFKALVNKAKYLSNHGKLNFILISSKGHVIPQISTNIIEVLDIDDSKAEDFLKNQGLPESWTKRLAKLAGNRMIYLCEVSTIYHRLLPMFTEAEGSLMTEDQFCREVDKQFKRLIQPSLDVLGDTRPTSDFIVRHILDNGPSCSILELETAFLNAFESSFESSFSRERAKEAEELTAMFRNVIARLVEKNFLRYQSNETVTWDSDLINRAVLNLYK